MKFSLVAYFNINKKQKNVYEITNLEDILGTNYNLKKLLEFTSTFKDDKELINYLIDNNLLPALYEGCAVGIGEYKDNKLVVRHKHVPYRNYKQFFELPILKYYYEKSLANPSFMIPFLQDHYYMLKNSTLNKDGKLDKQAENLSILWAYERAYLQEHILPDDAIRRIDNFIKFYITNKKNTINFTQYTKLLMCIIDYEENKKANNMKKIAEEKNKVLGILKASYANASKEERKNILDEYESESAYFEQLELEYEEDNNDDLINHYYSLLENGNLTDEDREAYLAKIDELESKKGRKR